MKTPQHSKQTNRNVCVCTWDTGYVLLLVETSCSSELNSFDNSSAVARDALKSSFMDWTECKEAHEKKNRRQSASTSEYTNTEAKRSSEATHKARCCHNLFGSSWRLWRSSFQLLKETRVWIIVTFSQFISSGRRHHCIRRVTYGQTDSQSGVTEPNVLTVHSAPSKWWESTLSLLAKTVTFDWRPRFPLRTSRNTACVKTCPLPHSLAKSQKFLEALLSWLWWPAQCHYCTHRPPRLSPPADAIPIRETRCCNLVLHTRYWSNPMAVSGKQAWYRHWNITLLQLPQPGG